MQQAQYDLSYQKPLLLSYRLFSHFSYLADLTLKYLRLKREHRILQQLKIQWQVREGRWLSGKLRHCFQFQTVRVLMEWFDAEIILLRMKFLIETSEKNCKQLRNTQPQAESAEGPQCFYNILNPSNKIQCDDCKRQISKTSKVLADDYDFCISCFSNLEDFPELYHLINKLDYPLFDPEWTADEELMLFEGLEKHGFGNWAEIAELIGTNKTREDVEEHYVAYYLDTADFLPTAQVITSRNEEGKLVKTGTEVPIKKFQRPISRIFSTNSAHSFQRGSLTVNQGNTGKAGSNPAEIVGYMPKRGDFEVEFDNEAELLLAEMEFNEDDSEEERKMKFRLIDIYNHKLNERLRRKEFVISRRLLDLKEQLRLDRTRSKEQKEIYNMMKVFARFSTHEQHELLVQGIIREKQIRARLEELKQLKNKGFRSLVETNEDLQGRKTKDHPTDTNPRDHTDHREHTEHREHTDHRDRRDRREHHRDHRDDPTTHERKAQQTPEGKKRSKRENMIQKAEKRPAFQNSAEEDICERFNISPQNYAMVKQVLIRESLRQGMVELDSAQKMFKIQRNAVEGILDFLVQKEDLISSWVERDSNDSL